MAWVRSKRIGFVQSLVLLVLAPGTARADWLLLLHADVSGKPGLNWEAKVETEVKFRNNMSEYYDLEAMPWVAYSFADWFRLGLGWRELFSRNDSAIYAQDASQDSERRLFRRVSNHYWQVEHRPLVDVMLTAKAVGWTLEERVRIEYRKLEAQDAYLRYRNRLRLRPPWKWSKADIQPWVAWEVYYEDTSKLSTRERLNRHRAYVGISAKLTKNVRVGTYYYYEQVLKSGHWATNNEIGLETGFDFGRGGQEQSTAGEHLAEPRTP
jgi:hypothetical protein